MPDTDRQMLIAGCDADASSGYGESAPADKLFPFFGFTAENIVAKAHKVLGVKGA